MMGSNAANCCNGQAKPTYVFAICGPKSLLPLDLEWRIRDSNPRPLACHASALPTELIPRGRITAGYKRSLAQPSTASVSSHASMPQMIAIRATKKGHIEYRYLSETARGFRLAATRLPNPGPGPPNGKGRRTRTAFGGPSHRREALARIPRSVAVTCGKARRSVKTAVHLFHPSPTAVLSTSLSAQAGIDGVVLLAWPL
jgi:hypothetical protein